MSCPVLSYVVEKYLLKIKRKVQLRRSFDESCSCSVLYLYRIVSRRDLCILEILFMANMLCIESAGEVFILNALQWYHVVIRNHKTWSFALYRYMRPNPSSNEPDFLHPLTYLNADRSLSIEF